MSPFIRPPASDGLRIRPMRHDEIAIAVDWAAAEGWNPGIADAACFATVDPKGFLIGELEGETAATVSCVNYDASFAFLGFYIVRADLRGRGFGLRIWNAAIAHAGSARDRARWRGGAAAELPEIRIRARLCQYPLRRHRRAPRRRRRLASSR